MRFLSIEPLLEPVTLQPWLAKGQIAWVIVGGESGPDFRPMDLGWARQVRDECAEYGVPFFFKQISARKAGQPGPPDLNIKEFPA